MYQVSVELPAQHQKNSLEEPFIALYSTNVHQENEPMLNFYRQVITEAMQKLLIPDAIKALRKDMIECGQKKVLQVIEDKFWCEATMPPLRLQYVAESPDDAPEVLSQLVPAWARSRNTPLHVPPSQCVLHDGAMSGQGPCCTELDG